MHNGFSSAMTSSKKPVVGAFARWWETEGLTVLPHEKNLRRKKHSMGCVHAMCTRCEEDCGKMSLSPGHRKDGRKPKAVLGYSKMSSSKVLLEPKGLRGGNFRWTGLSSLTTFGWLLALPGPAKSRSLQRRPDQTIRSKQHHNRGVPKNDVFLVSS